MSYFTRKSMAEEVGQRIVDPVEACDAMDEEERRAVGSESPGEESFPPNILVVDDDPLFRANFRQIAKKRHIAVTVCSSLEEVSMMSSCPKLFDIAIVDYYLDDLKNRLRGTEIAGLLESTPVILISNTDHGIENYTPFPQSVRRFVNKKIGIDAILDTALRASGGAV